MKIVGPFRQILTLNQLPLRGKIDDAQLEIIEDGGIAIDCGNGTIAKVGDFEKLQQNFPDASLEFVEGDCIAMPAFVDSHTHICFGGSRANDFAMRNAGRTYLEIAEAGGGIWSTVQNTRLASSVSLEEGLVERLNDCARQGIATVEVKSGYGLNTEEELKMLHTIKNVAKKHSLSIISTCLAAHMKPRDFSGSSSEYLDSILNDLLPKILEEKLSKRVDIFIEKSAFQPEESMKFLLKAKEMGFDLTVHADQFTSGSSRVAVEAGARSADHLEATSEEDIRFLAESDTVATALPGASLGLGEPFTPARKLLDAGAILAIASDWNPGSAPMGNLLAQASILATYEKLTSAEVFAALTFRAAHALGFNDRGILKEGLKSDFSIFNTANYQDVLYRQGSLLPSKLYVNGNIYHAI